jgi:RNA polymerase sigma-70 factor (ECF subfamily)
MRFRQDLSQTEIAERIGLPLGTVKTRMNRGLGRLREMLNAADWQGDV